MGERNRNAVALLCAVLFAGAASVLQAQQPPSVEQEVERVQQENADRRQSSRLVGEGDSLAIEFADGQRSPVGPSANCEPPRSGGGVIQLDCAGLDDGVVYYFDEATRAMIESCGGWRDDPLRCPPPQWPIEMPGCAGSIPQSIAGTWVYYALPRADGFFPMVGGWTMTLRGGSALFDFNGLARVVRSYTSVESGDGRYALEFKDSRSTTTALQVQLVQCGIVVEGPGVCDAFCSNVAGEFGIPNLPQRLEPLFAERVYFRAVTAGQ